MYTFPDQCTCLIVFLECIRLNPTSERCRVCSPARDMHTSRRPLVLPKHHQPHKYIPFSPPALHLGDACWRNSSSPIASLFTLEPGRATRQSAFSEYHTCYDCASSAGFWRWQPVGCLQTHARVCMLKACEKNWDGQGHAAWLQTRDAVDDGVKKASRVWISWWKYIAFTSMCGTSLFSRIWSPHCVLGVSRRSGSSPRVLDMKSYSRIYLSCVWVVGGWLTSLLFSKIIPPSMIISRT